MPRAHLSHPFEAVYRVILIGLVWLSSASAALEPKDYYDDVGRLLYSIDAEGTVSMFETDALDNTVSVTRGDHETMKPRVTEVVPPTIETGKTSVLVFKGSNLIGAKLSTATPGVRFGVTAPRARSVGVPVDVEIGVPLGPVVVELATPIGKSTATLTVTEPTVDLAAATQKKEPEYIELPAGKPESCPDGMIPIAGASGGFCVDIQETQAGDWVAVEKLCANNFKRLCWSEEWEQACKQDQRHSLGLQALLGEWEWTRSSEYAAAGELASGGLVTENQDWLAVVRGKKDCATKDRKDPWVGGNRPGRCCK
jgi:YD repeat-containing protein